MKRKGVGLRLSLLTVFLSTLRGLCAKQLQELSQIQALWFECVARIFQVQILSEDLCALASVGEARLVEDQVHSYRTRQSSVDTIDVIARVISGLAGWRSEACPELGKTLYCSRQSVCKV